MHRPAAALLLVVALPPLAGLAARTQPADAAPAATQGAQTPDGPLTAVVTAFEGIVAVRPAPDAPWTKPTVGMQLQEGAEFRTGPKSAIQFQIPPDQTITLDRLGVVQLIRANFTDGKVITDLGMKYGRTRYDIEAAGREHDARVRSPSSVLAVRGTSFLAYDQPPFAHEAVSLEGRVQVRDIRKQVTIGARRNAAKARVTANEGSAAETARVATYQTARTTEGARSGNENQLGLTVQNFLTEPDLQVGVFEIFATAQAEATLNSLNVIGVLPNPGLASFELAFGGSPNADVDLIVTSPLGEVVTIANDFNNPVPSGGTYFVNAPADPTGVGGFDQVLWTTTAPTGVYTVEQVLKSGASADTSLIVLSDKNSSDPQVFGPINNTLTPSNPRSTLQLNLTPTEQAGQRSVQSVKKPGSSKKKR